MIRICPDEGEAKYEVMRTHLEVFEPTAASKRADERGGLG